MKRPKIYISGPITKGNRNWNYFQAVEAERELMFCGFAPLNPMRSMVLPFAWESSIPHSMWLECDLPWVECCDAVMRLPGDSEGADIEVAHAKKCGIPVFYSIDELKEWKDARRTNSSE